jgi:thiamine-monophosphate kinase
MALSEFELIRTYFQRAGLMADPARHPGVVLGIGDDCALLSVAETHHVALSLDLLVSGVHFPPDADAALLAQRALAVNLSDLAAMGATPLGFTLGLALPSFDAHWLEQFSTGLSQSAQHYQCPLLGGDTTRGPLTIAIQVQGAVPRGLALRRDAARVGDNVYVSGSLGRAGLALSVLDGTLTQASEAQRRELLAAYYQPQPQLVLGQALLGIARAAQDVSDGLLADAGHIAGQSQVRMQLDVAAIPVAPVLKSLCSEQQALELALTAGDDYELVFTAAADQHLAVMAAAARNNVSATQIGTVVAGSGVVVLDASGATMQFAKAGYSHF